MNKAIKTVRAFQEGSTVTFTKTINEHDINIFAELTGDFSPNHVEEEFMRNSSLENVLLTAPY